MRQVQLKEKKTEHMTITAPDGVSFEINGFDATANSRLIDLITGLAISEGQ